MKIEDSIKGFASRLLQERLDGKLKNPSDVLGIALECQPLNGFSNADWSNICEFILVIEKADNIPAARKLAEEHGLTLEY